MLQAVYPLTSMAISVILLYFVASPYYRVADKIIPSFFGCERAALLWRSLNYACEWSTSWRSTWRHMVMKRMYNAKYQDGKLLD
jgi:hypothetical protein